MSSFREAVPSDVQGQLSLAMCRDNPPPPPPPPPRLEGIFTSGRQQRNAFYWLSHRINYIEMLICSVCWGFIDNIVKRLHTTRLGYGYVSFIPVFQKSQIRKHSYSFYRLSGWINSVYFAVYSHYSLVQTTLIAWLTDVWALTMTRARGKVSKDRYSTIFHYMVKHSHKPMVIL